MYRVLCFTFILFSSIARAEINIKTLDKLVFQWSQLEQQHSEIDLAWREQKPILEQQLQLLNEEKKQLVSLLSKHTTENTGVKQKRVELLTEQTAMENVQVLMQTALLKASRELTKMHKLLPPPIQEKWNADIAILQSTLIGDDDQLLTNSERLEKLLLMLNTIERFEERPALHQTKMRIPRLNQVSINNVDDNENIADKSVYIEVDQVYFGISQGWYISQHGDYWGSGMSTPSGWQWQHQLEDVNVEELHKTVAMLKNPSLAGMVSLPVKLLTSPSSLLGEADE